MLEILLEFSPQMLVGQRACVLGAEHGHIGAFALRVVGEERLVIAPFAHNPVRELERLLDGEVAELLRIQRPPVGSEFERRALPLVFLLAPPLAEAGDELWSLFHAGYWSVCGSSLKRGSCFKCSSCR